MILSFPVGSYHGWWVCGKYLSIELSNLTNLEHIYSYFNQNDFNDPFDCIFPNPQFNTKNVKRKLKELIKKIPNLEIFDAPGPKEIEEAKKTLKAFANSDGGAIAVDGKMIDEPVVKLMKKKLILAGLDPDN